MIHDSSIKLHKTTLPNSSHQNLRAKDRKAPEEQGRGQQAPRQTTHERLHGLGS